MIIGNDLKLIFFGSKICGSFILDCKLSQLIGFYYACLTSFYLFFKSLQKFPSSWVGAVQEISYMLMSFLGLEFFMQNDAHHE